MRTSVKRLIKQQGQDNSLRKPTSTATIFDKDTKTVRNRAKRKRQKAA